MQARTLVRNIYVVRYVPTCSEVELTDHAFKPRTKRPNTGHANCRASADTKKYKIMGALSLRVILHNSIIKPFAPDHVINRSFVLTSFRMMPLLRRTRRLPVTLFEYLSEQKLSDESHGAVCLPRFARRRPLGLIPHTPCKKVAATRCAHAHWPPAIEDPTSVLTSLFQALRPGRASA